MGIKLDKAVSVDFQKPLPIKEMTVLSGPLVAASVVKDTDALFPQIKIIWPIEVGPENTFKELGDCYKPGIFNGKTFSMLPLGYRLSVLASRDMVRKVVKNEEGEVVYERAYKPFEDVAGETAVQFAEGSASTDRELWQKGASYILACFLPTGEVALVELEACKSMHKYWGIPLNQAIFTNILAMKVNLVNHNVNLEKSPKGQYLSNKKFKQWEIVELTKTDIEALKPVYEEALPKIIEWRKK